MTTEVRDNNGWKAFVYRYGYLPSEGYGLMSIERPPHWSEATAACHEYACRASTPPIPRYSIPHIPVDEYVLLFRSGVDLREDVGAKYEQTTLTQSR
ncbi:MAG: hypothetical protein CV088_14350 [Nitrospira sp. LK70]|nr:hypothetical protein [Nitrospira sp. LK70]